MGTTFVQANPLKVGLVFGIFLGTWHTGWAVLVATGIAQKIMDFLFWVHFITPPYHVEAFTLSRAAILVGVTFAVGLASGFIGAIIWNIFHRAHR
jgi:hypothetical protein